MRIRQKSDNPSSLLEDGSKQMNSISIVCNEKEKDKWVRIEDRLFELQSGNLFCVYLNENLEFAHAEQLNETISNKATIADFQRLKPLDAAIQAIRVNDGRENEAAGAETKQQPTDDRAKLLGNWTVMGLEHDGTADDSMHWFRMMVVEDAATGLLTMKITDTGGAVSDLYES